MTILLTERIHESGMSLLAERFDLRVAPDTSKDTLLELLPDAIAVVTRLTAIDRELIEAGRNLAVIGRHGVGVDNIDIVAAHERGISVVTTGDANATAVAEHAMFAVGALLRNIPQFDADVRRGDWSSRNRYLGSEVAGKVLGIVGLGSIGLRLARIAANGFGMQVHYFDPFAPLGHREEAAQWSAVSHRDLDSLLAEADVLSVHVPLTDETTGMIDADRLAKMRPGALVINFARGGIVDEEALVDAITRGRLRGAALDVFTEEPPDPAKSAVLGLPGQILLSPHTAFLTEESLEKMAIVLAQAVADAVESAGRR